MTDPLLSPLLASHDMIHALPPTHLISTDIDPCLDESIAFSNKLVKAGVRVILVSPIFAFILNLVEDLKYIYVFR